MFMSIIKIKNFTKFVVQNTLKLFATERLPKSTYFVSGENTFWGYYDEVPLFKNGCVYHVYKSNTPPIFINLFFRQLSNFSSKKMKTRLIGKSNIFSYQFGIRPISFKNKLFFLNSYKTNIVTDVYNTDFSYYQRFDFPIFKVTNKFLISLDLSKFTKHDPDYAFFKSGNLIPYCNKSFPVRFYDKNAILDDDWIISKLKDLNLNNDFCCTHFSEHEDLLAFIIRRRDSFGKTDKLCLIDTRRKTAKISEVFSEISHFCFVKKKIFIYARVLGIGWAFYFYNYKNDSIKLLRKCHDGHPVLVKSKIYIDSYPRFFPLIKFGPFNEFPILKIRHNPVKASIYRTDFHPRFGRDYIFFDSARNGKRSCGFFNFYKV